MQKSSKTHYLVWLLVALSLALNLYGIDWGLPNGDRDWANDSVAPLDPLVYAKRLLDQQGWVSKYPPFHFMALIFFYAPYLAYLYLTGGLVSPKDVYPYGLQDPEFSLMILTLIARLTSALMGIGLVLVTYYTVKRLYDRRAGLISGFLIASSYAIIYYSHNANIDVPHLFWIALALYSFVSLIKTHKTKYYVLLGLFAVLAVGTKNSAYALLSGLILPLLYFHIRHELSAEGGGRLLPALFHRKLLLGLAVSVVAFVVVFNLPINWQGFVGHIQFHLGRSVKGSIVIKRSASVAEGNLLLVGRYFLYILQANGLPAFLLMAAGVLYCLWRFPGKSWPFLFPMATYYLLFLRLHGTNHLRYILPVYLLFTWFGGKLAADLVAYKKIPRGISVAVVGLILAHSLLYGFSLDLLLARDSRYAAEEWMRKNLPAEAVVSAQGPSYTFPRFPAGVQLKYVETKGRDEEDLGAAEADYLVLNMSLPVRAKNRIRIYQLLHDRGFRPIASFKSATPVFGADLFHAVNPEIVIFKHFDSHDDNERS